MSAEDVSLAWFAKAVVAATFLLILIGGHTTTSGAGMAFPDWPLSHGSLNPPGWWEDLMQRLEHGHRYTAEAVGVMIGVLCAWVWRRKWAVPLAFGGAGLIAAGCAALGAAKEVVVHAMLWSSALIFLGILLWGKGGGRQMRDARVRWLAFAAFIGVCVQAVLGGLRVIQDPAGTAAGHAATAMTFRVVHGCFAQVELCVLVCLATMLAPGWSRLRASNDLRALQTFAWLTAAAVCLQLLVGAAMRHLGAGLAIPTFPHVDGGWWPREHNVFTQLNFAHTRLGAALASALVLSAVWQALTNARGQSHIARAGTLLLVLLLGQLTMGAFVIWHGRPPILTTLHVVNGAAVLAATVLLALRAGRILSAPPLVHGVVEQPREVSA